MGRHPAPPGGGVSKLKRSLVRIARRPKAGEDDAVAAEVAVVGAVDAHGTAPLHKAEHQRLHDRPVLQKTNKNIRRGMPFDLAHFAPNIHQWVESNQLNSNKLLDANI